MLKFRKVVASSLAVLAFSLALPVLAASHRGGEWTYGGHHVPNNWGAFSNYYHGSEDHWAYVGSNGRDNQKQLMQEHVVRPMRLLIQILGSKLHLMRDGKE